MDDRRSSSPGPAPSAPPPPKRDSSQRFTILLTVFGVVVSLSLMDFVILRRTGRFLVEPWLYFYLISIHCVFLAAVAIALIGRALFASRRRTITIVASILMLFYFPLGTLLGVYGLSRVDRGAWA